MDSIKDIIPRVISPLSEGKTNSTDIAEEWKRLSGGVNTSAVVGLKEGTLTVHVDCSARLVRMNQQKEQILEKLGGKFPQIKNIRFKVGKVT